MPVLLLLWISPLSAQLAARVAINGEPGGGILSVQVESVAPLEQSSPISLGVELLNRGSLADINLQSNLFSLAPLPGLASPPSSAADGNSFSCQYPECAENTAETDLLTTLSCNGEQCHPQSECSMAQVIAGSEECRLQLEGMRLLILRDVGFEFDSARLTDAARAKLEQMIPLFRLHPEARFAIYGHTDSRGGTSYNLRLSQERARTVRDFFIAAGIEAGRLTYRGFGSSQPIAPNLTSEGEDNPEGRARNRRVELSVVDEETFTRVAAQRREIDRRLQAEREQLAALIRQRERERKSAVAAREAERQEERAEQAAETEATQSEYLEFLREQEAGNDALAAKDDSPAAGDDDERSRPHENYTLEVRRLEVEDF